MARVQIENLNFSVGDVPILDDVNLVVAEGKCLGLLGPSGCGKTTTLRAIAGFVRPTSGDVRLNDRSVLGLPPHRRNVGLVFQDYALFPHMNVAENIAFGLRMRHVGGAEKNRRIEDALALVQLGDMGERMPDELSGGQRQRVALARALVIHPDVLLLDEPLGALDRRLRDQMQVELKRIQREAAITTIIVTHDQEEALSLSDEVAVMFDGSIAEVGAPTDLYRAPQSHAVMEFLGTSNIVEAMVEQADATGCRVRVADSLILKSSAQAIAGERIRVGIRPERIAISQQQPEGATNVIAGTVQESVYKGTHAEVFVKTDAGPVFTVRWRESAQSTPDDARVGAQVFLQVPPASVLLFE